MSTHIESTIGKLPEELAKTGVSGEQRVFVTILDEAEAAKLEELRRLIDEGDNSGPPLDAEEVFAQLEKDLVDAYPELANAAS